MRVIFVSIAALLAAACQPSGTPDEQVDTPPAENVLEETPDTPASAPAPAPDAEGAMCGGVAGVTCPAGLYCEQPEGQCLEVMDGSGTCQPIPDFCTEEYSPVCGCNGQTYANACKAAADGASVAAEGQCAGADIE